MSDSEGSGSEDPVREVPPWKLSLLNCLDGIRTAGDFSWMKSYAEFVNPGIEIDGHGLFPLPLRPHDAELIKKSCRSAPFGKGDETLVDESVRKTWELDPSEFRLSNPSWQDFLNKNIVAHASEKLGLEDASVKLHKLLLYEPGSFFKKHRDSQKESGMVGSIVVCLPSEHEGSSVHLSFNGKERTYSTGPVSKFDLSALAWFGDVSHEVKQLMSGYRLVLTYNIIVPPRPIVPSASFFNMQTEKLQNALTEWRLTDMSGFGFSFRTYYPLEHKYSESSLSMGNLQGRDAAVCQLLHHVAPACGFSVFLASMTQHKERDPDDPDGAYNVDYTVMEKMYTCQGRLAAEDLRVPQDEIPQCLLRDDDDDYDDVDESEYVGNENSPAHYRYHDTVLAIWATANLQSLFGLGRHNVHIDTLISQVSNDIKDLEDDHEAVIGVSRFMEACCLKPGFHPRSTLPLVIRWSFELDLATLFGAAFHAGRSDIRVQVELARAINRAHSVDIGREGVEAGKWDKWLGIIVKHAPSISSLRSTLGSFAINLNNADIRASFLEWKDSTLKNQLETRRIICDGDCNVALEILLTRHTDATWVTSGLLPNLCSAGTTSFFFQFLDRVFESKELSLDEIKTIFRNSLENSKGIQNWATDFKSWCPDAFVKLIHQSLSLDLNVSVCHILEESRKSFETALFTHCSKYTFVSFLRNLAQQLQKKVDLGNSVTSALKAFFQTTITVGVLRELPVYPKERFKDYWIINMDWLQGWSMPAQGCTNSSCSSCKDLRDFLLAEDQTDTRFQGQSKASHIKEYTCCYKTLKFTEESSVSDGNDGKVLVLKKVKTIFQKDVDAFEAEIRALEQLVLCLKGQFLEKLLGNDSYRKLILLEGIRPDTGNIEGSERKRPAEGELEKIEIEKRHKTTV